MNCTKTQEKEITKEQILAAQKTWGEGIVECSASKKNGEDYVKLAGDLIKSHYAFGESPVLFKPTLAAEKQFRANYEEALSYFAASNGVVAEDTGFAIKGWTDVRWENADILTVGRQGLAMGNYYFTLDGEETKVEYTFGYYLDDNDNVKINLHHSSIPYQP